MKPLDTRAEKARLLKTIACAEIALVEAAEIRSADALGETAEDTRARWNEAYKIETAATACRKAARAALARVTGVVTSAPEDLPGWIEEAREAALALKAAIDDHRERAQRRRAERKEGGAL